MTAETSIKPIRNKQDYTLALAKVDELFDTEEGSREADLRDVLIVLIEKYEAETSPVELPDPISAIKFRMDQQGLTQRDLIPFIGSRSKVSEILSGKRTLNIKMIRGLHRHLGIPAEALLNEKSIATIEDIQGEDFDHFPIREMFKYKAFEDLGITEVRDNGEELIRGLVTKTGYNPSLSAIQFRKSKSSRLNAKLNPYALQAWILHLVHEASKIQGPYKHEKETTDPQWISSLVHLSILDNGPKLAQEFLGKYGIKLIILQHYRNTYLDGAAYITPKNEPIIGLTLRNDRIDNFWFTLLHELGHIALHLPPGNLSADDMSLRNGPTLDPFEIEADEFAERALFPEGFPFESEGKVDRKQVLGYAKEHHLHPAIVAGKIQFLKNNFRLFSNMVGRGEVRKLFF